MDYLLAAKKFVQRGREAVTVDVIKTHLEMAEWYLTQAIQERDGAPNQDESD